MNLRRIGGSSPVSAGQDLSSFSAPGFRISRNTVGAMGEPLEGLEDFDEASPSAEADGASESDRSRSEGSVFFADAQE